MTEKEKNEQYIRFVWMLVRIIADDGFCWPEDHKLPIGVYAATYIDENTGKFYNNPCHRTCAEDKKDFIGMVDELSPIFDDAVVMAERIWNFSNDFPERFGLDYGDFEAVNDWICVGDFYLTEFVVEENGVIRFFGVRRDTPDEVYDEIQIETKEDLENVISFIEEI